MVTIGDDLDADRAARALSKLFGRVGGARLLVASDIERGAGHLRREREHIGRVLQPIDEALRGDHVPPAGHQHELLAASGGDESAGLRGDLLYAVARHHPGTARALHHISAAAVGRQQDERGRARMIDDVTHGEHAAVAVSDHDRVREAALPEPLRRKPVVFDAFLRGLESTAHRSAAVAGAQDVVAAAVEGEAGEPELHEHRRQETQRAGVEVHRVAVEEQYSSGGGTPVGLVVGSIKGFGVGRDGNEFRQQLHVVTPLNEIKIDIFGAFLQNVLNDSNAPSGSEYKPASY